MAKSGAERQAKYRRKRATAGPQGDGERRVDLWVSYAAFFALRRLSKHHGIGQGRVLEDLILAADTKMTQGMTDEDFDKYLNAT